MAELIGGLAAEWLESRHAELNQRFERKRRRVPALSSEAVLARLSEVLPRLAGPEESSGELLSAVFDLVLLHTARNSFAAHPGIAVLLRDVFPRIRGLLLERPSMLPGALSNAVENMRDRGAAFASAIGELAPAIDRAELLLDAVAVLAWRHGEARLRETALETGARLPPKLFLRALGLSAWPEEAASIVIAGLRASAWRHPRELLSAAPMPRPEWSVVASVGEFSGFGGNFDSPPLLLAGGSAHRFFVRAGASEYVVDADGFGWVCTPRPISGMPVGSNASTFRRIPLFERATSWVVFPGVVAVTHADSHRIRIVAPPDEPR